MVPDDSTNFMTEVVGILVGDVEPDDVRESTQIPGSIGSVPRVPGSA